MSLKITFFAPVESVTGTHGHHDGKPLVFRKAPSGYTYAYLRGARKKPPTQAELDCRKVFTEAQRRAKEIMANPEERSWWESQYNSLPIKGRKKSLRAYIIHVIYPVVKRELFGD